MLTVCCDANQSTSSHRPMSHSDNRMILTIVVNYLPIHGAGRSAKVKYRACEVDLALYARTVGHELAMKKEIHKLVHVPRGYSQQDLKENSIKTALRYQAKMKCDYGSCITYVILFRNSNIYMVGLDQPET